MGASTLTRTHRTFPDRGEALAHFFARAGEAPRLVAYDDEMGCPLDTALAALEWTNAVGILADTDLMHAARLGGDSAAPMVARRRAPPSAGCPPCSRRHRASVPRNSWRPGSRPRALGSCSCRGARGSRFSTKKSGPDPSTSVRRRVMHNSTRRGQLLQPLGLYAVSRPHRTHTESRNPKEHRRLRAFERSLDLPPRRTREGSGLAVLTTPCVGGPSGDSGEGADANKGFGRPAIRVATPARTGEASRVPRPRRSSASACRAKGRAATRYQSPRAHQSRRRLREEEQWE